MQKLSVCIGILSGILGAALLWGVQTLVHTEPPTIATLNVRALIDAEITRVAKSKMTDKKAAEQVKAYGKRLSQLAEHITKKQNIVLLPESAVIAGAVDVTPLIRERVRSEDGGPKTEDGKKRIEF